MSRPNSVTWTAAAVLLQEAVDAQLTEGRLTDEQYDAMMSIVWLIDSFDECDREEPVECGECRYNDDGVLVVGQNGEPIEDGETK